MIFRVNCASKNKSIVRSEEEKHYVWVSVGSKWVKWLNHCVVYISISLAGSYGMCKTFPDLLGREANKNNWRMSSMNVILSGTRWYKSNI